MKKTQHIVGLGLLVNEKKQVLITLRNDPDNAEFHNKWEIPGGTVEFGESITNATVRELEEEVGVRAQIIHPYPLVSHNVRTYHSTRHQFFLIMYLCRTTDTPHPANEETLDTRWIGPHEIIRLDHLPNADTLILQAKDIIDTQL